MWMFRIDGMIQVSTPVAVSPHALTGVENAKTIQHLLQASTYTTRTGSILSHWGMRSPTYLADCLTLPRSMEGEYLGVSSSNIASRSI